MKTSENREIKLSRISPLSLKSWKYLCTKYMAYIVPNTTRALRSTTSREDSTHQIFATRPASHSWSGTGKLNLCGVRRPLEKKKNTHLNSWSDLWDSNCRLGMDGQLVLGIELLVSPICLLLQTLGHFLHLLLLNVIVLLILQEEKNSTARHIVTWEQERHYCNGWG